MGSNVLGYRRQKIGSSLEETMTCNDVKIPLVAIANKIDDQGI